MRIDPISSDRAIPSPDLDYLIGRAENVREAMLKRSDRQKDKIRTDLLTDPDRVAASETFRAVHANVEMFGLDQVFPILEPPLPPEERPGDSDGTRTESVGMMRREAFDG